jgi:hypothetical protein
MTRLITGIAALLIAGAAALPLPASAMEHGITKAQSTELSSQRRWHRHYVRRHYWGPRYYARPYWGPRYRYGYGYPYRYRHYGYYGYPYYRRPGLAFGIGPFGFGVF